MHRFTLAAMSLLAALLLNTAEASVIKFSGAPATTFADGTFTHNLTGLWNDGFARGINDFWAYNNYGGNGESILFNAPVTLNSLRTTNCGGCGGHAEVLTIDLFGATNSLLNSLTVSLTRTPQLLTFDLANVSKATFTYSGGTADVYHDGRQVAWFSIGDVTYSATSVPEPASLALLGIGIIGLGISRRKRTH